MAWKFIESFLFSVFRCDRISDALKTDCDGHDELLALLFSTVSGTAVVLVLFFSFFSLVCALIKSVSTKLVMRAR